MPLFKIIIQTTYHHKKVDSIFRWFIKDSYKTITYDQLNEKLQNIINKLNSCNPNHNDNDLIEDYQILWYDGEDFCRIISTEDLHDAIETLTEPNDNNKPIRIYIATNGCELIKQQLNPILKEKKSINELQLPDLPETLEKLDINNNDLDTNKKSIINNQTSSSSIDPLNTNLDHDPILPSAPLLNSTSMDLFLSSLQLPYNHLNYMKLPQNYQAYATTTTYIPYQQPYLQNKMNLTKLPSPSSSSALSLRSLSSSALRSSSSSLRSSSSSSTCIQSNQINDKQRILTNHYGLKRNSQYTTSCMNLTRLPNSSCHSNNNKDQINISAIIIRLRHMGFQQSDMYLSSLIQQYNGNINPILDRLSFENNMKS